MQTETDLGGYGRRWVRGDYETSDMEEVWSSPMQPRPPRGIDPREGLGNLCICLVEHCTPSCWE